MSYRRPGTFWGMSLSAAMLMGACKGPIVDPTPTTTLSGVVFEMTAAGQVPLQGALVKSMNGGGSATSGQNGRYELPARDPMVLEISKWQFETAHQNVSISGNTVADFQIVHKPARTLSGVVTEDTPTGRRPVEGVYVDVLLCPPQDPGKYSTVNGITDENGFYSVPNLCDGATTAFAVKADYRLAPTADPPCEEAHWECKYLTIAGDTRFDIQLAKVN